MSKFKPFHEFQKPLIGFTPESFLDYIETVIPPDPLCRLVNEVVFSLDTEPIEAKYSFSARIILKKSRSILWILSEYLAH